MISFENIHKHNSLYTILNEYIRQMHNRVYYSKIQVVGYENVPPEGYPILVIANHQNAVMDPLGMLYFYKDRRQPVFIARGDVFKVSNVVARVLRFMKILPTFRSRDGGREDIKSNLETFDLAARILNEGGTLTMFPEAGHQQGRYFSTFKKGFPRIAFAAAEMSGFQLDFKILPIFIYYTDPFNFRAQQLMVVGEPFHISEFYDLYKEEPNKAYLAMNEKARETVRSMGVDISDIEHYAQYDTVCTVCRSAFIQEKQMTPGDPLSAMLADKETIARVQALDTERHSDFEILMQQASEYKEKLYALRLRDWLFEASITKHCNWGIAALLLLTFPFFLFGMINNIIPFKAPLPLTRNVKDKMFTSTFNFCIGAILSFPICYIALYIVVCSLTNWWIALLYIVAAFLTLFCYFYWKKAFVKFLGRCRFRRYEQRQNPDWLRLKELRAAIRAAVCSR